MKAFAALLDHLIFQPSRRGKLRLLAEYFATTPDPDRGYGLAAIAGTLRIPHAKPALLRDLIIARTDPVLFAYSYDYVGDLAETIALMWPGSGAGAAPRLAEVVMTLGNRRKAEVPDVIGRWLDGLDATGRWALLKLLTGGLRIGVSARLAKTALAQWGRLDLADIEELWHGQAPPYAELFAWAEKGGDKPAAAHAAFRPFMLSHAIAENEFAVLDPADFIAEWKWDGIRVQVAGSVLGQPRLFARSGDDISGAFPDVIADAHFDAVLDGELLVRGDGGESSLAARVAPFSDLQQRLNRKTVSRKLLDTHPAFVRVYDILFLGGADLRPLPWLERRAKLETFMVGPRARFDLSPTVDFDSWAALMQIRATARLAGMEGLMLKRRDAPYIAGRPKGPWFKWKRAPLTIDAVLMYAQRGHGKRSSFYSDYTFGLWQDDQLVPIGKAYFGFTDSELKQLDSWVRTHTTERFGPVRAVAPGLVLEVAFDAAQRSTRHKSGIALRFPRIARIRWDKPAAEADRLETVARLLPA